MISHLFRGKISFVWKGEQFFGDGEGEQGTQEGNEPKVFLAMPTRQIPVGVMVVSHHTAPTVAEVGCMQMGVSLVVRRNVVVGIILDPRSSGWHKGGVRHGGPSGLERVTACSQGSALASGNTIF